MPIYKIEVARGLKAIGQMMDCTAETAKKLHTEKQLPLIKEGGQWTMSNVDYLKWRKWLGGECGESFQDLRECSGQTL